jgi:hypothetical protein
VENVLIVQENVVVLDVTVILIGENVEAVKVPYHSLHLYQDNLM